jgi:hypothetical protein
VQTFDPPKLTDIQSGESDGGRRVPMVAVVFLVVMSVTSGLAGVVCVIYSGWTYLGSVEALGRIPQAVKDSIRSQATIQFIVGSVLIAACFGLVAITVTLARNHDG